MSDISGISLSTSLISEKSRLPKTVMQKIAAIIKCYGFFSFLRAVIKRVWIEILNRFTSKKYIKARIYNYSMYLDIKDPGISRTLLLYGKRELDHKIILEKIMTANTRVLDIGANIGYYAIMESKFSGGQSYLLAIEPSPDNVTLLKKNLSLNQLNNITVLQGAVSNVSAQKQFFLARSSNLNTFHREGLETNEWSDNTIEVTTFTIPELAKRYGKFDLMRMDVEGHEVEVLEGMLADDSNQSLIPMIIFETHNSRYNKDHDMIELLKRLYQKGYRIRYLASASKEGSRKIEKMGYPSLQAIHTDMLTRDLYENILEEDGIELICHSGARTVLLVRS